jgi:hypothetical protein
MPYRRHPTDHREARARPSDEDWRGAVENARDYRWLVAWQRNNNFSDEQAADEASSSIFCSYRQVRFGRGPSWSL